jgi:hypothetical protein
MIESPKAPEKAPTTAEKFRGECVFFNRYEYSPTKRKCYAARVDYWYLINARSKSLDPVMPP